MVVVQGIYLVIVEVTVEVGQAVERVTPVRMV